MHESVEKRGERSERASGFEKFENPRELSEDSYMQCKNCSSLIEDFEGTLRHHWNYHRAEKFCFRGDFFSSVVEDMYRAYTNARPLLLALSTDEVKCSQENGKEASKAPAKEGVKDTKEVKVTPRVVLGPGATLVHGAESEVQAQLLSVTQVPSRIVTMLNSSSNSKFASPPQPALLSRK